FILIALSAATNAQEQKVNIKVAPTDAIVIVDGKIVKLQDGKATLTLPAEIEYTYSVACNGYEGADGSFRLKSKSSFNLTVELNRETGTECVAATTDVTEDKLEDFLKTQYESKNYSLMLPVINRFPDNAHSLFYKGCLYYYGRGVDKDRAKAIELWQRSAEKDCGDAYNRLGLVAESGYFTGSAGDKANQLGAEYYKKAIALGNSMAKYNLAVSYYNGSIKRNDKEAFRLFGEAANEGNADAMALYGRCIELNYDKDYFKGISKDERLAEALRWIRKSAENGSTSGCYYLGRAYYYGKLGLASNTMEAYEWFKKGADNGDSDCTYFIQQHYKL
ncbi:MAG: sel1 repeat family protein, partial [Muribaculaceae bacterium]|nr:sel1 repeat family protein [Muribaculaceae bacterium]